MGTASVMTFALVGIDAVPVHVEAHVRPGLPGVTVVGLPDTSVREAKEQVRSAAANVGLPLPTQRITVGLSPADVRKEGSAFDLPVALAILAAAGHVPSGSLRHIGAVGELGLDGEIRGVRGILAMSEAAERIGLRSVLLPVESLLEGSAAAPELVVGVRVWPRRWLHAEINRCLAVSGCVGSGGSHASPRRELLQVTARFL